MPKNSGKAADRSTEEAPSYALGHRTRIEMLSALNEGERSASELAHLVGQPLNDVTYHLGELLASGSIEIAEVREAGNVEQKIYRSVSTGFFDEEEWASLTFEQRQAIHALVIQNSSAEAMNSLWSGAISNEPKSWMVWNWFHLDRQGWKDACIVFQRAWDQFSAIEAESNARRAQSGEEASPYICNLQGYPRTGTTRDRARRRRGIPFEI